MNHYNKTILLLVDEVQKISLLEGQALIEVKSWFCICQINVNSNYQKDNLIKHFRIKQCTQVPYCLASTRI